jgi:integrase
MRTTHTFGLQFILRPNKKDQNSGIIYVRITIEGQRSEISLKKNLPTSQWNNARGKANGSSKDAKSLNAYLDDIRIKLTECYRELQLKQDKITTDSIKALFLGDHSDQHTLAELIEYHNLSQFPILSISTRKCYIITKNYILSFLNKKRNTMDIYLSKIDFKFISDFDYYLRTIKPLDHHQPLNNNGLMKHMQRFRKILNLGVRLEWLTKNPFNAYDIRFNKFERGFLTKYELDLIEKKIFSIERLQMIKDLFIFSCYTGLAYIDAINLTTSEISIGIDGQKWIYTTREKTQTSLKIPVLQQALDILERYNVNPRSINRGTIFPLVSNQKVNGYLKEIADICQIEKRLTFHLARHTFATTVTLSNGVPIETVSNLLGHRSISTTQIYAKVLENKVSEDMVKLRDKLSENKLITKEKSVG